MKILKLIGGFVLDYAPGHRVYFRGHTVFGPAFLDLYALYVSGRIDPGVPGGVVNASGVDNRIRLPGYLVANARLGVNIVQGLSVAVLRNFNPQSKMIFLKSTGGDTVGSPVTVVTESFLSNLT